MAKLVVLMMCFAVCAGAGCGAWLLATQSDADYRILGAVLIAVNAGFGTWGAILHRRAVRKGWLR